MASVQPLVPMTVDPVPAGVTAAPQFTPPQAQPLPCSPVQPAAVTTAAWPWRATCCSTARTTGCSPPSTPGTGSTRWPFDGTSVTKAGGAAALPSVNVAGGREYVIQAFGGNRNDRSRTASPIGDAAALPNAAAK